MRAIVVLVALLTLLAPGAGLAGELSPRATTAPDPIVLGGADGAAAPATASIEVRGLPGRGPLAVAANVGSIDGVEERADAARVRYRLPAASFPQMLCLLLWRAGGAARVVRIPLLGQAVLPIHTRPNSQVTVTVGGRGFGPASSDREGKLSIAVVVPPGTRRGEAVAVDEIGLTTRKAIAIERPAYQLLTLAILPRRAPAPGPRFEVTVAAAEPVPRPLRLEVRAPGAAEGTRLSLTADGEGRWRATWSPGPGTAPGRFEVRASLEGSAEAQTVEGEILRAPEPPPSPPRPRALVRRPASLERPARRLLGRLAASVGLVHNFGELSSPCFTLEAGADYPLGPGRIGLLISAGLAWASQQLVDSRGSAATRLGWLFAPIALGAGYRLAFGRISPYLSGAFVTQVVRTSGDDLAGRFVRTDAVPSVRGLLGTEIGLGPGGFFGQLGYQWGRLSVPEVEALVGGLLVELGYRLRI